MENEHLSRSACNVAAHFFSKSWGLASRKHEKPFGSWQGLYWMLYIQLKRPCFSHGLFFREKCRSRKSRRPRPVPLHWNSSVPSGFRIANESVLARRLCSLQFFFCANASPKIENLAFFQGCSHNPDTECAWLWGFSASFCHVFSRHTGRRRCFGVKNCTQHFQDIIILQVTSGDFRWLQVTSGNLRYLLGRLIGHPQKTIQFLSSSGSTGSTSDRPWPADLCLFALSFYHVSLGGTEQQFRNLQQLGSKYLSQNTFKLMELWCDIFRKKKSPESRWLRRPFFHGRLLWSSTPNSWTSNSDVGWAAGFSETFVVCRQNGCVACWNSLGNQLTINVIHLFPILLRENSSLPLSNSTEPRCRGFGCYAPILVCASASWPLFGWHFFFRFPTVQVKIAHCWVPNWISETYS